MPKSFLTKTYKNKFSKVMVSQMVLEDKDFDKLAKVTGTTPRTCRNRLDHPDKMPVWELMLYVKALKVPEEKVIDFIYRREDD